jgi:transcriptional regulator
MRATPGDGLMPLKDIAAELGVTHQCVSFIEKRALEKLRRILERRGMTLSDLIPDSAVRHDCRVD